MVRLSVNVHIYTYTVIVYGVFAMHTCGVYVYNLMSPLTVRLYRELRESVEGQLAGEGGEKGRQGGGAGKSKALGALQTQLTAISKVCVLSHTLHIHVPIIG